MSKRQRARGNVIPARTVDATGSTYCAHERAGGQTDKRHNLTKMVT